MTPDTPSPKWLKTVGIGVFLLIAIGSSLGLIGKTELLQKALHAPDAILKPLIFVLLALPLLAIFALRARKPIGVLVIAGLLVASTVGFSHFEKLHDQGRGTDQPDCVIIAGTHLLSGEWPYQRAEMWTHNRMSCGPGWAAFQAPFVKTVGYSATLILLWAASIWAFWKYLGLERTLAVLTLLAFCPSFWLAASNGTDFLTFGACIAALTVVAERERRLPWLQAIVGGLVAQFRFPSIYAPIFMSKTKAATTGAWACFIAIAGQAVFLIWNGYEYISDGPMFVLSKFFQTDFSSDISPIAIALFIAALLAILGVLILIGRKIGGIWATLAYLALIFVIPAIQDIPTKLQVLPDVITAFEFWEGGIWIVACLPLAAVALVVTLEKLAPLEVSEEKTGIETDRHKHVELATLSAL